MSLTAQDKEVLRTLAKRYAEYAALPVQKERKELWLSLNRGQMQRPMLMIDQIPWNEMDVDGSLQCQVGDPYWRWVETWLRQTLYKWERMPADMVLDPYITLARPIENSGFGVAIHNETKVYDETSAVRGMSFENQFESMEDVEKIKIPTVRLNKEAEAQIIAEATDLFDGIIPFKMVGHTLHLGLWDTITQWMGVENCYIELMDRPELMHAIMEKLTVGMIATIEQMNEQGLFDCYTHLCHCSHTYCDDLPRPGCDVDHPTSENVWAFGLAQLFSSVSPKITEEFEVPYMQRIFPYFGAIYYGCCDRLDDRLDIIAKMPKIRKVSCSPWSNRENFAQNLPKEYIMSNKPNPALVAKDTMDEEEIRADIRRTVQAARDNGLGLELILKDISTVRYEPQRLWTWSRIALEEVSR